MSDPAEFDWSSECAIPSHFVARITTEVRRLDRITARHGVVDLYPVLRNWADKIALWCCTAWAICLPGKCQGKAVAGEVHCYILFVLAHREESCAASGPDASTCSILKIKKMMFNPAAFLFWGYRFVHSLVSFFPALFFAYMISLHERTLCNLKVIGCSSLIRGGGELGTNKNLDLWLQLVCTKLKLKHAI